MGLHVGSISVACSQRGFYGKVDARLEEKRLESDTGRTVAVSITYAAKMIAEQRLARARCHSFTQHMVTTVACGQPVSARE